MRTSAPAQDTILISIRPEYVRAILNGTKTCEYRRIVPSKPVSRLLIYETSPAKHIAGEAEILDILEFPVEELWEFTEAQGGLSKAAYMQYFHGRKTGHAILLGSVTAYAEPVSLENIGLTRAPQSWMYIKVSG
ncbi:MAG: ASCH domain-containing protein [Clostridia bacterium]|nr:ASCH domain-containing protein [Clostridia bacterium]